MRSPSLFAFFLLVSGAVLAQDRPGLFFREDFKETPAEIPASQAHIANPDLLLGLYGPGRDVIKKSNHDKPADDPFYIWSGLCEDTWAVTLKHKTQNVDLSRMGTIRWRSKQTGFRTLHLVLKLADGTWLVSQPLDPPSSDWRIREFNLSDMAWRALNMETVVETRPVNNPDLTRVEEIGWTDLMKGGGTPASSRVDWIEVSGFPVDR